jgi:C1A family cysteine protease
MGHAFSVVGYTEDAFILRNSWGETWGKQGYCHFPFADFGQQWEIWSVLFNDS